MTTGRVVFRGPKQSREWLFAKMLGVDHDAWRNPNTNQVEPTTFLQVSNRQKTSGVSYSDVGAPLFRFRLAIAMARANGDEQDLRTEVMKAIDAHASERPVAPAELEPPAGEPVDADGVS